MEPLNLGNLVERRKQSIFSDLFSDSHMNACYTCRVMCSGMVLPIW
jgi:hypothetical protein